jgi:hypothetical protein
MASPAVIRMTPLTGQFGPAATSMVYPVSAGSSRALARSDGEITVPAPTIVTESAGRIDAIAATHSRGTLATVTSPIWCASLRSNRADAVWWTDSGAQITTRE